MSEERLTERVCESNVRENSCGQALQEGVGRSQMAKLQELRGVKVKCMDKKTGKGLNICYLTERC